MGVFGLLPQGSIKWRIVNKMSKPIMMNALSYMDGAMHDITMEKKARGWVNPETQILWEIFTEIMDRDKCIRKGDNEYDPIRLVFENMRNVTCTMLDEDSHYFLRFLYFIELVNERYADFKIATHKNKAYWNWEQTYAGLKKDRQIHNDKAKDKTDSNPSTSTP